MKLEIPTPEKPARRANPLYHDVIARLRMKTHLTKAINLIFLAKRLFRENSTLSFLTHSSRTLQMSQHTDVYKWQQLKDRPSTWVRATYGSELFYSRFGAMSDG